MGKHLFCSKVHVADYPPRQNISQLPPSLNSAKLTLSPLKDTPSPAGIRSFLLSGSLRPSFLQNSVQLGARIPAPLFSIPRFLLCSESHQRQFHRACIRLVTSSSPACFSVSFSSFFFLIHEQAGKKAFSSFPPLLMKWP